MCCQKSSKHVTFFDFLRSFVWRTQQLCHSASQTSSLTCLSSPAAALLQWSLWWWVTEHVHKLYKHSGCLVGQILSSARTGNRARVQRHSHGSAPVPCESCIQTRTQPRQADDAVLRRRQMTSNLSSLERRAPTTVTWPVGLGHVLLDRCVFGQAIVVVWSVGRQSPTITPSFDFTADFRSLMY